MNSAEGSSAEWRRKFAGGIASLLVLFLLALLFLSVRLVRVEDVFSQERLTFLDSDTYTRMERVRQVEERGWLPVRFHNFENAPYGLVSHATSPLDYSILLLSLPLRPFMSTEHSRDMAGAWISPIAGLIGLIVLWRLLSGVRGRWWALLAYSILPALAWAQNVGRPDHQCLLVVLLTWAVACEFLALSGKKSSRLFVFSGLCWGLALWVSFFEPLIFGIILFTLQLILREGSWLKRGIPFFVPMVSLLVLRFIIDPWPNLPDSADTIYLKNWGALIGELRGSTILEMVYWTGFWIPVLLISCFIFWQKKEADARSKATMLFVLLTLITLLTFWQIRWSPYLAVIIAVPGMLVFFKDKKIGKSIFVAAISCLMIPLYYAQSVFQWRQPIEGVEDSHRVAKVLSEQPDILLAPWWLSPKLGYLSGSKFVASSSHQSITGIVDVSEFFLTPYWKDAREILLERNVGWVVTAEPERMYSQSLAIARGLFVPTDEAVLNKDIAYRTALGTRLSRGINPSPDELFLKTVLGPYRVYRFRPRTPVELP